MDIIICTVLHFLLTQRLHTVVLRVFDKSSTFQTSVPKNTGVQITSEVISRNLENKTDKELENISVKNNSINVIQELRRFTIEVRISSEKLLKK